MYNAFCESNLKSVDWSVSYDPTSYCTRYSITKKGRTKIIAKPSRNNYIQVHDICKGRSLEVSAKVMVMFHLRVGITSSCNSTLSISRKMKRMLKKAHAFDHHCGVC